MVLAMRRKAAFLVTDSRDRKVKIAGEGPRHDKASGRSEANQPDPMKTSFRYIWRRERLHANVRSVGVAGKVPAVRKVVNVVGAAIASGDDAKITSFASSEAN